MQEKFTYREKFALSYCYPAICFAALALLSGIFKYSIRFKRFTLLSYPYSLYIFILCAALFAAYAYYKYSSSKKSAANPFPVELTDTTLQFPKGNSSVVIHIADINELYTGNDKDEGRRIAIETKGGSYNFFEDRFESAAEFDRFENLLRERCAADA
ncbi:MAG: hypothetical protein LBT84_07495 [Spirochaetia bacterium]|nr:hypothetical protein [Spirochaetia bacterium]